MSMSISTALAKGLLDTGSLKDMLTGMKLKLYGGAVPASADASLGAATLLSTITVDDAGTALSFEANAVANVIQKNSSETWQGTNVATGTATFCRLELDSDTGGSTTTEVRLQGDVGVAGRFLNISSTLLTSGAVQGIDNFSIAMPLS
ncbi:hypothetical protein ACF8C6_09105 [Pseudomonas sp. zbq_18]|uniref:hypothetical protein n=1 Tax=Pseudomonas sp. zbq_18 TaxID=3367251 RepID=UPI00370ADCE3